MNKDISIEEAIFSLSDQIPSMGSETICTSDANSRVLAADISAAMDLPPFNKSVYDGFALSSALTENADRNAPAVFRIVNTISAGDFCREKLDDGCASRIMTGAPLPEGADCVINFERVTESENMLSISEALRPWQNVDKKGSEFKAGTVLFKRGSLITPSHIGVLASQGIEKLPVYKRPSAAILSTGSELINPGEPLTPGKIYNSNLYVFRALLIREGLSIGSFDHAIDDEQLITEKLISLAGQNDLIISTGGASVGDKDYILRSLIDAGADILFAHVRMKPGSCCYGARLGRATIISLSGNPGAALTGYFRIALPFIRKLLGRSDYSLKEELLPLSVNYSKTCPFPRILKGHCESRNGVRYFVPHEGQKNGMMTSFLNMEALAELPPTDTVTEAGSFVKVFFP